MKICKDCGKEFEDGDRFCDRCGIPLPDTTYTKKKHIDTVKGRRDKKILLIYTTILSLVYLSIIIINL
jgi:uncharacterized membrane protein YvbJ